MALSLVDIWVFLRDWSVKKPIIVPIYGTSSQLGRQTQLFLALSSGKSPSAHHCAHLFLSFLLFPADMREEAAPHQCQLSGSLVGSAACDWAFYCRPVSGPITRSDSWCLEVSALTYSKKKWRASSQKDKKGNCIISYPKIYNVKNDALGLYVP